MNNELEIVNNNIFSIINEEEEKFLDRPKEAAISNYSYDSCNTFVSKLGLNNKKYFVAVDETATILIDMLFKNNVDNDTLVVITELEHPSVTTNAFCSKNLLILTREDISQLNTSKIIDEYNKVHANKIFLSFIGTHHQGGEIIPDTFFIKVKDDLRNIPHKIMIDDCQSLCIIKRNYDLFDYIVGTAHLMIKKFNMGILLYKDVNEKYGKDAYNWVEDYIERLNIFVPKLKFYGFDFNIKMKDIFSALLSTGKVKLYNSVPHIFTLKILDTLKITDEEIEKLISYNISIFKTEDKKSFDIRFRFADIMLCPEDFFNGLNYLYTILSKEYPSICYENFKGIKDDRCSKDS